MSAFTKRGNLGFTAGKKLRQWEEEVEENSNWIRLWHRVRVDKEEEYKMWFKWKNKDIFGLTFRVRSTKHYWNPQQKNGRWNIHLCTTADLCLQFSISLQRIKIVLKRCLVEITASYNQNCLIRDGVLCLCSCQFDSSSSYVDFSFKLLNQHVYCM